MRLSPPRRREQPRSPLAFSIASMDGSPTRQRLLRRSNALPVFSTQSGDPRYVTPPGSTMSATTRTSPSQASTRSMAHAGCASTAGSTKPAGLSPGTRRLSKSSAVRTRHPARRGVRPSATARCLRACLGRPHIVSERRAVGRGATHRRNRQPLSARLDRPRSHPRVDAAAADSHCADRGSPARRVMRRSARRNRARRAPKRPALARLLSEVRRSGMLQEVLEPQSRRVMDLKILQLIQGDPTNLL
jgi:hypothetical protein